MKNYSEIKGRRVLLLEPNYANKYPPMALMKLATYHRRQGWKVTFYKGDLQRFVAGRLTIRLLAKLEKQMPSIRWGKYYPEFEQYIWKRDDCPLKKVMGAFGENLIPAFQQLVDARLAFEQKRYFNEPEWDRVLITTLFTFHAAVTIDTIRFAQQLAPNDRIMVGGVMASVVPKYIEEETGIHPTVGLLNCPSIFGDPPLDVNIDDLPLDYSILEEIDYRYPAEDAYFAHTTRGCPNHCQFCAVPTLEPTYQAYRPLKEKLEFERKMFGARSKLLLLDNNVFASKEFPKIIDEIKDCGFANGAKISMPDALALCVERLKESKPYNPSAYIKKGVEVLQGFAEGIKDETTKAVVLASLSKYNADRNWRGTTRREFLALAKEIMPIWQKARRPTSRTAEVDFNQGLDSRLSTKPNIMTKLAEIPIRPVRIAFDHWELRAKYEEAICAAASAGLRRMSNYILYNFEDTPEALYWRLRLNVALCEELGISIYSFPMKYHPIRDPEYFNNRHYLGRHWCRKYIRFVQTVLVSTMGKVGCGKTFFFKAFGTSTTEFRELLLMPEFMIQNRHDCELSGLTERWRRALRSLSEEESKVVQRHLLLDDYKDPQSWMDQSSAVQDFMNYYSMNFSDVERPSEKEKQKAIKAFEKKWACQKARMSDDEISFETEASTRWPFRIDRG